MTVCLAMIVKDEAENLTRCLDAAKPITDTVFLIDTGSTDGTQQVARKWAKKAKMPLTVIEEPWENFAVNRTSLIRQAAEHGDWILMLDADLVLHAPDPLPDLERVDSWHGTVKFRGLEYTLPMLIRSGKPWRYDGVAHAHLACAEQFDEAVLDGLWVEDYSRTTVEKLRRDLKALSAEHARNPLHPRTTFYLAQTYYDLDMHHEAIQFYRARSNMKNGWDEETYYATYRLGCLLCEHVSYLEGARELMRAWEMRPARAEALRVLANVTENVANKIPYPPDRLFVHRNAYREPPPPPAEVALPFPNIAPRVTYPAPASPTFDDVTAILVTRGNVDMQPIIDTLPYGETIVWDNSQRPDYKILGRYAAIPEATRPIVYWQDDDVIFTAHDELLAAYQPGRLVSNMDTDWINGAGYGDFLAMVGAGSLCDAQLPAEVFARYLADHPFDDDLLVECDFAFGVLAPFTRVDVGYQTRGFTDDPDRLYLQPGQTARKWAMIDRCRAMLRAAA